MKAMLPSTLALRETSRQTIGRLQTELAQAQIEVSSGRHADVGNAIGRDVAAALDIRRISTDLDALAQSNAIVSVRYQQTQSALGVARELAEGFMETLFSSMQSGGDRSTLIEDAKSRLGTLIDVLSTTSNGVYVFSGINASEPPLTSYLVEPPGAGRTAVTTASTTAFGFAPDDPQASAITPGQMETYLDGSFAGLFDDPAWQSTFSAASSTSLRDRISARDTIEQPVTANSDGLRSLFKVLVATIDSGAEALSADTFRTFAESGIKATGAAVNGIVRSQSDLGIAEDRLAKASDRINLERDIVERRVAELEGVDSYEAATRLNTLVTQLETSYAVTARLQQLTLLSYL